jgi:hypothetical protein
MACGVADREKNRFVFGARLREGFLSPWKPFDRIGGVLQKVRTALVRQAIHDRIMTFVSTSATALQRFDSRK